METDHLRLYDTPVPSQQIQAVSYRYETRETVDVNEQTGDTSDGPF